MLPKSNTREVLIGIPTRGNDLTVNLVTSLNKFGYEVCFSQCNFSAQIAQEKCFEMAYENGSNLIMVDSDVSTSKETLDKLVNSEKHVICAPVIHYDMFKKEIHVDACPEGVRNFTIKNNGIEKIEHSSFSCLFVSYDVLKIFVDRKEKFTEFDSNVNKLSSDQVFFEKLQQMEIPAYVNWDCRDTTHNRMVELSIESIKSLFEKVRIDEYQSVR